MATYPSDNDMSDPPALATLFPPKPLMATGTTTNLRRSPRKKASTQEAAPQKKETRRNASPMKRKENTVTAPKAEKLEELHVKAKSRIPLGDIPLLPRNTTVSETLLTSNNRQSPAALQRNLKLAHVESTLLTLKSLALDVDEAENSNPNLDKQRAQTRTRRQQTERSKPQARPVAKVNVRVQRKKQTQHYTSRFVLKEARCNDDERDSNDEEEEDETDLSGFIVDDAAELSTYNTSAAESDDEEEVQRIHTKHTQKPGPRRRRLQRGSPTRRRLTFGSDAEEGDSSKENHAGDMLANAMKNISINDMKGNTREQEIEVIDLTSSPARESVTQLDNKVDLPSLPTHHINSRNDLTPDSNPFKDVATILKFSPPSSVPILALPAKHMPSRQDANLSDADELQQPSDHDNGRFKTPPATPPPSPSKLKSPRKLFSPSKKDLNPHSPHRQSMDGFWDHNVINEWNDEYSPKKAPVASPAKRGLAKFQIWSDSEDEMNDNSIGSSDSLPSPCLSPSKSRSPAKSPEKAAKARLLEEKRAAKAAKEAFDSRKEQLALDLLHELDRSVASGQLAKLSSSTGGVQVAWSKTLRSTAGRANWRRTVTKLSGSPVKGNPSSSDPTVRVQHFASIELADKIIDCEDRLVNTLAHEFCHLTNFMISNVRDQPHGASFKTWATKVTNHLRTTSTPSWHKVEVTTKHSYVINHKYLWVCTGRPRNSAMAFLNVEDDEGCGAEYGRHSKSIDSDKHRCGKCKGLLVQVRPKPRGVASPKKKTVGTRALSRSGSGESKSARSSSSGSGSQSGGLSKLVETVEISD